MSAKNKLTIHQNKFVEAMSDPKTKNQTQAAIKAGCPPKNARITAAKWLTKANILEAITKRKQRALAHSCITPEEVLGSAVFQMRSSMNDVLDENGSFDIEKARATGAVDLLKRHKETIKTDAEGNITRTIEVELLTNQDARKEVANYIGVERLSPDKPQTLEDKARELYRRAVEVLGYTEQEALEGVQIIFPEIDVKLLAADI